MHPGHLLPFSLEPSCMLYFCSLGVAVAIALYLLQPQRVGTYQKCTVVTLRTNANSQNSSIHCSLRFADRITVADGQAQRFEWRVGLCSD